MRRNYLGEVGAVQPPDLFGGFTQGMQIGTQQRLGREREQATNALAEAMQNGGVNNPNFLAALAKVDPAGAANFQVGREDQAFTRAHQDRQFGLQEREFEARRQQIAQQQAQASARMAQARREAEASGRTAQLEAEVRANTAVAQTLLSIPAGPQREAALAQAKAMLEAKGMGWVDLGTTDDELRLGMAVLNGKAVDMPAAPETAIAALRERANEAGLRPGTPEYQQFMAQGGARRQDSRIVRGADGQVVYAEGPVAAASFTEGQGKDVVYATRAEGALGILNEYAPALTSFGNQALNADPTGVARGALQTPEYQLARQAGDEFLQAILRKDTGAAITSDEQQLYGDTYLPRPGDGPAVLQQKEQARARALAAMKAGMGPAQIVAQERALGRVRSTVGPEASGLPNVGRGSVEDLLRKYE